MNRRHRGVDFEDDEGDEERQRDDQGVPVGVHRGRTVAGRCASCPPWPSTIGGHVVGVGDLLDQAAHVCVVEDVEDPDPFPAAADEPGQAGLARC